jgi:dATP pyrophosphohydrolase
MPLITCTIVDVCVFRFVGDHPEYLLLKRAAKEKIYPGIWQMVSGTIDESERATDTAMRELREETGLTPLRFWVVPHVNVFYDHDYDAVNLSPMFAAQVSAGVDPVLSTEHIEYAWLTHDDARSRLVWPVQRAGLDVVQRHVLTGEQSGILTMISLPR